MIRLLGLLSLTLALCACADSDPQMASEQTADPQKPTLFHGGTIITVDDANPRVDAMVVRGKFIVATGTQADMESQFPDAKQHNLQGHTIIPGIIDSHVHVHQLGTENLKANLVGTETVDAMVERLKDYFPNPAPGDWLIGQGWDEGTWASRGYPDRAALDAAFPNNPVLLQSLHGFAGFYNGAALDAASITNDTQDPEVGQILRRENGEATGVMLTLARKLVEEKAPPASFAQVKSAILSGMNTMAAAGVTSIHEAGMSPMNMRAFQELANAGELPIRVYGMLDGNDEPLMQRMFENGPIIDPAAMYTVRSIKVFYDGSLGSRTALLKEPYSDKPEDANPTERITPEKVSSLAARAAKYGFQMAVHTIGDEGNDRILNIYQTALKDYPNFDHRWRLEHAQVVLPDYYERVAKMGAISSMQPSHAVGDSGWAEDRVGPDRIKHAYAWRSILEAGGKLVFNSDLPGEPWQPMQTLYFAVTKNKLGAADAGGWYTDQALSVSESLNAMTAAGAHAAFSENKLGRLKAGYLADFIILDADPNAVDPSGIQDIKVLQTWVAGKRLVF